MSKKYKAIVSAHMYLADGRNLEVEILSQIDNDDYTDIFSDIDHALLDQIKPVLHEDNNYDYYFMAIVESEFTESFNGEHTEYDVEHEVIEIKKIKDLIST